LGIENHHPVPHLLQRRGVCGRHRIEDVKAEQRDGISRDPQEKATTSGSCGIGQGSRAASTTYNPREAMFPSSMITTGNDAAESG